MLTSDKLTPLIRELEQVEYNLKMLEESIKFTPDLKNPQEKFLCERYGSLCFVGGKVDLTEVTTKRLMKDLHSILKVEANKLQKDISKKLGVGADYDE